jgi:hypothetical protein
MHERFEQRRGRPERGGNGEDRRRSRSPRDERFYDEGQSEQRERFARDFEGEGSWAGLGSDYGQEDQYDERQRWQRGEGRFESEREFDERRGFGERGRFGGGEDWMQPRFASDRERGQGFGGYGERGQGFGGYGERGYGRGRFGQGGQGAGRSPSFGGRGSGGYEPGSHGQQGGFGRPGRFGPQGGFGQDRERELGGYGSYGGYGPSEQEQAWGTGGGPERWQSGRGAMQRGGFESETEPGRGWQQHGGPHLGKGPKGYRRSDERVLDDVCQALERDPRIDASDIEVTCTNGEVTLRGTVDSRETKRRAEDCVEDLPGVRDVRNELRTQPAKVSGEQAGSAGRSSGRSADKSGEKSAS